ncbi:MAG: glycosyltransferase, partial [Thermoleophilaceae bacterium]
MSERGSPPVVRIEWVDAAQAPPELDLAAADEWRILLQLDGAACGLIRLPNPGAGADVGLITAAIMRHADGARAYRSFVADFRRRMGAAPVRDYRVPTCSVVVCTHRRPSYLTGVLAGLAHLDPAPMEIVVVDNDPGPADCRAQVERAGARYVREDRRGLNNARSAGAHAARGEVVAFLDDDCLPAPHWLRALPELFDDPMVGAVTGPAFAFALTTPSQRQRDVIAGFVHGYTRTTYDWAVLRPVHSGSVGAGANMIFRHECLTQLGQIFPPDLDVGTPAQSGGDLYALYKVLAGGYRVTYDPGTFVFHRHRADAPALLETVRGYGIGSAAFLTKVLVEERELAAFAIWRWLPQQYLIAQVARAVGRGDAATVRLRWEYLRSSLGGPAAWLSARRMAGGRDGGLTPARGLTPESAPAPRGEKNPTVSLIVSGADPATVDRCADHVERQAATEPFEVVRAAEGRTRAARRNAGAAAARGELLVFLDAELVPEPGLVDGHLAARRTSPSPDVVLGYCRSQPSTRLAAMHDALVREDHFTAKRDAVALTFADVVAANMSVTREAFERVGAFDESLVAYEDWDWGVRARAAGLDLVYAHDAAAHHEPSALTTVARIERARAEGRAEAVLHGRHGISLAAPPKRRRLALVFGAALGQAGPMPAAALLNALELLRARRTWLRLFRLVLAGARTRGWVESGGSGVPGGGAPLEDVDLDSDVAIPVPHVAVPTLCLKRDGEQLGTLAPRRAQWYGRLAEEAARRLAVVWWADRGNRWWTRLPGAGAAGLQAVPEVADTTGALLVRGQDWAAIDAEIRQSGARVAAIPLPRVATGDSWLGAVVPALEGARVACVVGAGLAPDEPPAPLVLHSRATLGEPYPTSVGHPPQYIAVR